MIDLSDKIDDLIVTVVGLDDKIIDSYTFK